MEMCTIWVAADGCGVGSHGSDGGGSSGENYVDIYLYTRIYFFWNYVYGEVEGKEKAWFT